MWRPIRKHRDSSDSHSEIILQLFLWATGIILGFGALVSIFICVLWFVIWLGKYLGLN